MGIRQVRVVCTAVFIALSQWGAIAFAATWSSALLASALLSPSWVAPASQSPAVPDLLLAEHYSSGVSLTEYWVSEKYDGVRAYWDGRQLISRQGNVYLAPDWFTQGFPPTPLDGELWLGRQRFQELVSVVRQQQPHAGWRHVIYQVFDLPAAPGNFDQRLPLLRQTIADAKVPWLRAVTQFRVADEAQLLGLLDEFVAQGAEGLMLHRGAAHYRSGRSRDLLKLKTSQDAEATVIAHLPGKGKYQRLLGALLVEMPGGQRFRLGSGFSDQERHAPPPVGSLITYRYNGLSTNGIPRFARFLRVRRE